MLILGVRRQIVLGNAIRHLLIGMLDHVVHSVLSWYLKCDVIGRMINQVESIFLKLSCSIKGWPIVSVFQIFKLRNVMSALYVPL